MQLLSKMNEENRLATWAIIGKDAAALFIPPDAFVCKKCITKAYIWLDGAGNLHNAGLLAVFADSEAHTGIRVLEVNHHEGARSQVA